MKKLICFYLVCFTISSNLFSQISLNGYIRDEKGSSIPYANILLSRYDSQITLAYTISDENGWFSLIYDGLKDSIVFKVTHIGYDEYRRDIIDQSQKFDVILVESNILLKGFEIKSPPLIRTKGDTLSYDVEGFMIESDRTISDVLKKMPGIEIQNDGKILYQGKPILKYYINGLDLLGSQYNIANNNLPANAVAQVEILENHQPIRMFHDVFKPDNASLNIKLKRDNTFIGEGRLGMGIPLGLYDFALSPMAFSNNYQMIATYQSNNIGIDVSNQLKKMTLEDLLQLNDGVFELNPWLKILHARPLSFPSRRWLDNNVHMVTPNVLLKLKKDYQLKLNISYLHDNQKQFGLTNTNLYNVNDTISIDEQKHNNLILDRFNGKAIIERNNTENYLNNTIEYSSGKSKEVGQISRVESDIEQLHKTKYQEFNNKFKYLIPIGKTVLNLNSTVYYSKLPELLTISPSNYLDFLDIGGVGTKLEQEVSIVRTVTNNSVGATHDFGKSKITVRGGFRTERNIAESELEIEHDDLSNDELDGQFQNHLRYVTSNFYTDLKSEHNFKGWLINLDVSLKWYDFKIRNYGMESDLSPKRSVIEPRFSISKKFSQKFSGSATYNINNVFGSLNNQMSGYILYDYRTINRNVPAFPHTFFQSTNIYLTFKSPKLLLYANGSYTYSKYKYNQTKLFTISELGLLSSLALDMNNYSDSHLGDLYFSRYVKRMKSTISVKVIGQLQTDMQMFDGELANFQFSSVKVNPKLLYNLSHNVNIEYGFIHATLNNHIDKIIRGTSEYQNHHMLISVFPKKLHYIGFNIDHFISNTNKSKIVNTFCDLVYRYTLKSNHALEINWINITDNRTYFEVNNSSFSNFNSSFRLNPTQLTFSIKFGF